MFSMSSINRYRKVNSFYTEGNTTLVVCFVMNMKNDLAFVLSGQIA